MGFTEETIIETKYGNLNAKFFKGEDDKFCLCVYKKPVNGALQSAVEGVLKNVPSSRRLAAS